MRQILDFNENWWFIHADVDVSEARPGEGELVSLPHTWNALDGQKGDGTYDRGSYWYVKMLDKWEPSAKYSRLFLEIPAAGQQAKVFVNGEFVVSHEGGYSAFRADITEKCTEEFNTIAIWCSNEKCDAIYPQSADFTFYGGLYRGAHLICVPETHFELLHYGDLGIHAATEPASWDKEDFMLHIRTKICGVEKDNQVIYQIFDEDGKEVASAARPADSPDTSIPLYKPHRWDIKNSYQYTLKALIMRNNECLDEVELKFGVRTFCCDPGRGFLINGNCVPLRGVSRHQDKLYQGNALTKEDHIRDAELIEEIGANTVRLAHYQHAQEFYNECDKRGFVVWAEIPFISVMNEDPLAHENCITQLKELIYQNDHHPSICFWGISNEILIGGISEKLVENHRELNALAKKIDPYRLTTIAHVTMTPKDGPMHEITDVESYNHYFGWYGGKTEDNGPWMDEYHEKYPNRCIGLSEYGCEGIITYQGGNPKCKDYSEAYQAGYHEYMAHMLERRPWIFCSYVWNMFDFGCAARSEGGVTGRNNKGLVTMDRKIKKDSFYLYKAYWNPEPMVHICDKRYSLRSGENTQIRVYTNQERVTLFVNGEEMAVNEVKRHVASFPISLSGGKNAILVKAGDVWDAVTIDRVEKEPESYVFPEASEREEGVANWFQEVGSLNLSEEMKYPEDRYHIRCTLEEISENDEAMELVTKAMKLITGMTLAKGEGMWDMMKKMKLESMKEMLGAMAPHGFLESLNMKLNEIKKENLNG